jgi:hypothetical protein
VIETLEVSDQTSRIMLGPTTCGTCSLPRHTIRECID